jgi:hypothetical protein
LGKVEPNFLQVDYFAPLFKKWKSGLFCSTFLKVEKWIILLYFFKSGKVDCFTPLFKKWKSGKVERWI